jgi:hypothetical protein
MNLRKVSLEILKAELSAREKLETLKTEIEKLCEKNEISLARFLEEFATGKKKAKSHKTSDVKPVCVSYTYTNENGEEVVLKRTEGQRGKDVFWPIVEEHIKAKILTKTKAKKLALTPVGEAYIEDKLKELI